MNVQKVNNIHIYKASAKGLQREEGTQFEANQHSERFHTNFSGIGSPLEITKPSSKDGIIYQLFKQPQESSQNSKTRENRHLFLPKFIGIGKSYKKPSEIIDDRSKTDLYNPEFSIRDREKVSSFIPSLDIKTEQCKVDEDYNPKRLFIPHYSRELKYESQNAQMAFQTISPVFQPSFNSVRCPLKLAKRPVQAPLDVEKQIQTLAHRVKCFWEGSTPMTPFPFKRQQYIFYKDSSDLDMMEVLDYSKKVIPDQSVDENEGFTN